MRSEPISRLIGLDFDNTIVCYDQAIERLAEQLLVLPPDIPRTKLGLRDYLRREGRESEWTVFQGTLYGPGMCHAQAFSGAIETLQRLKTEGHRLVIVSHRSRHPYAGPCHDLHAAARQWVSARLQPAGLFTDDAVHFLETRQEKIATIVRLGCDLFLDDLPEVLSAPDFPARKAGVLFDPTGQQSSPPGCARISAWAQLPDLLSRLP